MAQKEPLVENVDMSGAKVPSVDQPAPGEPRSTEERAARAVRHEEALARRLRSYYSELIAEPLPDQFLALLAQLEATEIEK